MKFKIFNKKFLSFKSIQSPFQKMVIPSKINGLNYVDIKSNSPKFKRFFFPSTKMRFYCNKIEQKEPLNKVWTIPNILSMSRIAMTPLIV